MNNYYINLAKSAVEIFIKEGRVMETPKDLPEEILGRRSGVFVSIEKNGELRGCIGTYLPTRKNVAEEIIHNAIVAASADYRFAAINKKELAELSYTIYLLSEPELAKDISELDPKKFGVIVKKAPDKAGLLLPDLEGVDTPERQLEIACQKGGIDPAEEPIIYRFSVQKFEEKTTQ